MKPEGFSQQPSYTPMAATQLVRFSPFFQSTLGPGSDRPLKEITEY
jgi:hypothetical protein